MKKLTAKKHQKLVNEFNSLNETIKQLENQKKELRQQLLDLSETKNSNSFETDTLTVEFKAVTRNIFDKKTYLHINGINSLDDYMTQSDSIRITVKAKTNLEVKKAS